METGNGSDGRPEGSTELVTAIVKLTNVVQGLDQLLRDEYPKRSEVERNFVSKLESKTYTVRLILVALLTVMACYATSTGAYALCFVGESNAAVCKYVPGYEDRLNRVADLNRKDTEQRKAQKEQELRIQRLEQELGIGPRKK